MRSCFLTFYVTPYVCSAGHHPFFYHVVGPKASMNSGYSHLRMFCSHSRHPWRTIQLWPQNLLPIVQQILKCHSIMGAHYYVGLSMNWVFLIGMACILFLRKMQFLFARSFLAFVTFWYHKQLAAGYAWIKALNTYPWKSCFHSCLFSTSMYLYAL